MGYPMTPKTMGRKGGKAGRGKSKRRGTSAYYKALQAKSAAAKKAVAQEKALDTEPPQA